MSVLLNKATCGDHASAIHSGTRLRYTILAAKLSANSCLSWAKRAEGRVDRVLQVEILIHRSGFATRALRSRVSFSTLPTSLHLFSGRAL